jgi:hypothetical protein
MLLVFDNLIRDVFDIYDTYDLDVRLDVLLCSSSLLESVRCIGLLSIYTRVEIPHVDSPPQFIFCCQCDSIYCEVFLCAML